MITSNTPKPNDYFIELPGVGKFRFNRKTYGAQIVIDSEFARLAGKEWESNDPGMNVHASLVGTYKATMVDCPAGWEDIEAIDISEGEDSEQNLMALFFAIKEKQDSFRKRKIQVEADKAASEAAAQDDGVLDPPQVQPGAN